MHDGISEKYIGRDYRDTIIAVVVVEWGKLPFGDCGMREQRADNVFLKLNLMSLMRCYFLWWSRFVTQVFIFKQFVFKYIMKS